MVDWWLFFGIFNLGNAPNLAFFFVIFSHLTIRKGQKVRININPSQNQDEFVGIGTSLEHVNTKKNKLLLTYFDILGCKVLFAGIRSVLLYLLPEIGVHISRLFYFPKPLFSPSPVGFVLCQRQLPNFDPFCSAKRPTTKNQTFVAWHFLVTSLFFKIRAIRFNQKKKKKP